MKVLSLSRETLEELERRHIEFLRSRLSSDAGKAEWIRLVRAGFDELLSRKLGEILDPPAVVEAIRRALRPEEIRSFFAPVILEVALRALALLRENDARIGEFVPAEARRSIDELLERRDLVPDPLVRKAFEQEAIIEAIDDTLYDGLTQFNSSVNPFFAEWGLPSVLKRIPFGGSIILSSMEAIRSEFEKRLEPEMRKFLSVFSRRAATEMASLFIAKSGEPQFIELRKNLAAFVYSQSFAELLAGADDESAKSVGHAVEIVVEELLRGDRGPDLLLEALQDFLAEHAELEVGQWLESIGAMRPSDVESWASATWPVVEGFARSSAGEDAIDRLVGDFYKSLDQS